ncbi:Kinase phosphorylation domain containing protein [Cryptosporidium felis]|nr:Kinase phosphorylation domain containing protein [Cryptosporidium felis]
MDLSDSHDVAKLSGVRGGAERFNWESLRNISRKEREHYLGQSLIFGTSKKNRYGQYNWHNKVHKQKLKHDTQEIQNERKRIIDRERKIMNKLLGICTLDEIKDIKNDVPIADKELMRDLEETKKVSSQQCYEENTKLEKAGSGSKTNEVEFKRTKKRSLSRSFSP